jgi:hypothetical protein
MFRCSHYGVTGSMRWSWVRLSLFDELSPEPQAEGTGHEREVTIFGFGCPCRNDSRCVAEPDGEVRSLGTIANREESIRKLIKKLGPVEQLRACYEAGPTGFVLYWQLAQLGVECEVMAPTLVPKKAGDRVKTDRRDAEAGAQSPVRRSDCGVGSG